jgi:choline dehydrogenase-like flavoprotein
VSGALLTRADLPGSGLVEDACDVVIVGSGPAGSTAARVLSAAGWDVIIVEEGAPFPPEARRGDAWTGFKHGWRDVSMQVAQGRAVTPFLQGKAVGGSTPINGAIIHRMPESIHAGWADRHGLGDTLPFADLERIFDQLDAELCVAPTPEEAWGGNNARFKQGADALGWVSNPTKRAVDGCARSARCNQGCATARKRSMDQTYIPRVIGEGARVYAECRVERIVEESGRAVGVVGRFRDPVKGTPSRRLRVHARRAVVLAAGAIHTPHLLLKHGLGKASPVLGQRLQAHPGASIMAIFDDPVRMFDGATQGYETTEFWGERMKFETVGLPPAVAVQRMPGFGPALMRRVANLDHIAHWGAQIRATTHGSVRKGWFGKPSIRWSLEPQDVARFKLCFRRLAELAFAAGARAIWPGIAGVPQTVRSMDELRVLDTLPDDPRLFHSICAHIFGTATVGTDPRSSVLRPTGESWSVKRLFAVDASVFPTNLGVNPQHTICAVAWKLAEGMADGAIESATNP